MTVSAIRQAASEQGLLHIPPVRQIGTKELRHLRKQGFRTYPQRPLSYSSLKEFAKSPLHYLEYLTRPSIHSDAMLAGKLFEALLLNEDLASSFVIFERPVADKDFRTKANREARDAARSEAYASQREAVEVQQIAALEPVVELARQHPFWKRLRRYAYKRPAQKTIIEPNSRLKLTGIPDLSFRRGKVGVDLKFVGSVAEFRQRIFGRSYAYWMQAAMYSLIYGYEEFVFFAVQSQPHHYAEAFQLDGECLALLRQKLIQEVLLKFRYHLHQGFRAEAQQVEVPLHFL
ncbi:MAG: PD-(D/E)XK nuclease-like domain-containing protein [Bacteroidota bacterium]